MAEGRRVAVTWRHEPQPGTTRAPRPPAGAAGCRTSPPPRSPPPAFPCSPAPAPAPEPRASSPPGGGTWQAAGPAIPAALARQHVAGLRLTQTAPGIAALLQAGTGATASLLAAWSADGGHWTVSPPLPLNGAALTCASFGPGGTAAIIISGNRGDIITSTGSPWQPLPPLPTGTATLAPGPGGAAGALAVDRSTMTVWQLAPGSAAWTRTQAINVPILYGSSS